MSAGDPIVRGWFGGSPAYKDIEAPEIRYEFVHAAANLVGVPVEKRLVRKMVCPDKDAQTVISSLKRHHVALTITVITSTGTTTVSYGNGWSIKNVGQSPYSKGFTEIKVEYTKSVVPAFEFDLPTGLTITQSGATVTVAYLGNTLETWTGASDNDGGIVTRMERKRLLGDYQGTNNVWVSIISLYVNGTLLESFDPDPANRPSFPTRTVYDVYETNMDYADWEALDANEQDEYLADYPDGTLTEARSRTVRASGYRLQSQTVASSVSSGVTQSDGLTRVYVIGDPSSADPLNNPAVSVVTCLALRIPRQITDPAYYYPQMGLLEWDTTSEADHIKLLWEGATWRDWDVTGLTA